MTTSLGRKAYSPVASTLKATKPETQFQILSSLKVSSPIESHDEHREVFGKVPWINSRSCILCINQDDAHSASETTGVSTSGLTQLKRIPTPITVRGLCRQAESWFFPSRVTTIFEGLLRGLH